MVLLGPTPQRYQLATGFVATNKPGKICICDICRNQVLESLGIWEAPTPHRTVTYYPNSTIAKTFYSWVESWWLTSIVAQKIHSVAHLNQYRKYSYNIIYINISYIILYISGCVFKSKWSNWKCEFQCHHLWCTQSFDHNVQRCFFSPNCFTIPSPPIRFSVIRKKTHHLTVAVLVVVTLKKYAIWYMVHQQDADNITNQQTSNILPQS